jgi:Methane oxygenase PmoA
MSAMSLKLTAALSGVALLALSSAAQKQAVPTITVDAGAFDRHATIATAIIPGAKESSAVFLNDGKGPTIPAQVGANGDVTFVLPELKAGETRTYVVAVGRPAAPVAVPPRPAVEARRDGAVVRVTAAGRRVLTYQAEPGELPRPDIKPIFRRGGYIHPVFTPEGRAITDDYPVDHPHHHGIWWAWTKTEYDGRQPDFWNMGDGTGRIDFDSLDRTWNGRIHGGLTATTRFTDVTGGRSEVVLKDRWDVRVYALEDSKFLVFDIVSTQNLAGNKPLVLPEYRYGGLGVRGHIQWNGKGDKTAFLTSEGKTREDGNGTSARWTHMGGVLDGRPAGIAILDHPSNFRSPQPTRLNPDNPFFNYSPSVAGNWTIEPGKPYVSRYRFVTYEGGPDRALLERLWNDYATPPVVTVNAR